MSNTKLPCIFTDNKFVNQSLNFVIGSVFKDKNEQTSVINLLCNLSRYLSVCKLTGAGIPECVELRKNMFNEILSMAGPISKDMDSKIDISEFIPGMGNYVNETNTLINTYNNYLQKGDMATEDVIGIINKYISFLNNITSFLPLGQNKLATINTIDINTIASDCKDAQQKMSENQNIINQLRSQLSQLNNEFTAYQKAHPLECKACLSTDSQPCPACPDSQPCQPCPDSQSNDCSKCQPKECPVSGDCQEKIDSLQKIIKDQSEFYSKTCEPEVYEGLNNQIKYLKATKEQMDIVGIIIVSILALLLLWLIWTFLINKKKLV
jgi:hypothetical protein